MTNTPIIPEAGTTNVETTILQRIAPPFFSFSFVLFVSLLASQTFLLPQVTTFRVGEVDVSVDEALAYERALRAELMTLEDERDELVLPYIDDTHDALMSRKRATPSVLDVRARIASAMENVAASVGASISVDAVQIDMTTRVVTVRGSVDDPKPSSMAVLSAAVDAVRSMEGVADLDPPALTREEVPGGGYRSPFKFSFTFDRGTAESRTVILSPSVNSGQASSKDDSSLLP